MSFSKNMDGFADRFGENVDKVVRSVALQSLSGVTLRTPVDSGRARGNWNVSLGAIDYSQKGKFDKVGMDTISAGDLVMGTYNGQSVYISNTLPYIKRLENGSSKKAPAGMVGVTKLEWPDYIDVAIKSL